MIPQKLKFSNDVVHVVRELCNVVFNIKSDEQLQKVFGLDQAQLNNVINKIIDALPDYFFEHINARMLEEVKNICAREFIFFQAQEKWDDPRYHDDLLNFIYVFSRDMQQRVGTHKSSKSKMQEE